MVREGRYSHYSVTMSSRVIHCRMVGHVVMHGKMDLALTSFFTRASV